MKVESETTKMPPMRSARKPRAGKQSQATGVNSIDSFFPLRSTLAFDRVDDQASLFEVLQGSQDMEVAVYDNQYLDLNDTGVRLERRLRTRITCRRT